MKDKVNNITNVYHLDFVDPLPQKGLTEIAKALAPKKRDAQSTSSAMATKMKSASWNKSAPEKLQSSCTVLKEKCGVVFKVCKYMSQSYLTDPEALNASLLQLEELKLRVPS